MCATAFDFCLTTVESRAKISNAFRNPAGLRVKLTAVASANASRFRDIADFNRRAASGARIKTRSENIKANGLLFPSRFRFPPKNIILVNMSDAIAIAPAVVAATALKVDSTGTMFGAKYAMGAVTLMASMGKRDDKSTVSVGTSAFGADKKITGLGVDYALGKRTILWARYENRDGDTTRSGTSTLNSSASWDATKTTAVGIRATF